MKLLPKIRKNIKPFLAQYGFSSKGRYFYKIQNDIAFCIGFERPSDSVYVKFYIIPLYMKTEMHYLTYGNRINNLYHNRLAEITGASTENEIFDWCNTLANILHEEVFPYFDKISSPSKLLSFLDRYPHEIPKYMFCGDWHIAKLRLYTSVYLHQHNRIASEIQTCRLALLDAPFIKELKNKLAAEIAHIEEISLRKDNYVDEYFRQISLKTISVCF